MADARTVKRLKAAYEGGGKDGFRQEGDRIVQREGRRIPGEAEKRLRRLTSISVRGSLGEKLALISHARFAAIDEEDLLTIAFAYKLVDLIPMAADRAKQVSDIIVREATSERAEKYLEEASYCYFYGLNTACAITCRSVLDEVIEHKMPRRVLKEWQQKQPDKAGNQHLTLGVLLHLSRYPTPGGEWSLPKIAYEAASEILAIGNRAAHANQMRSNA